MAVPITVSAVQGFRLFRHVLRVFDGRLFMSPGVGYDLSSEFAPVWTPEGPNTVADLGLSVWLEPTPPAYADDSGGAPGGSYEVERLLPLVGDWTIVIGRIVYNWPVAPEANSSPPYVNYIDQQFQVMWALKATVDGYLAGPPLELWRGAGYKTYNPITFMQGTFVTDPDGHQVSGVGAGEGSTLKMWSPGDVHTFTIGSEGDITPTWGSSDFAQVRADQMAAYGDEALVQEGDSLIRFASDGSTSVVHELGIPNDAFNWVSTPVRVAPGRYCWVESEDLYDPATPDASVIARHWLCSWSASGFTRVQIDTPAVREPFLWSDGVYNDHIFDVVRIAGQYDSVARGTIVLTREIHGQRIDDDWGGYAVTNVMRACIVTLAGEVRAPWFEVGRGVREEVGAS